MQNREFGSVVRQKNISFVSFLVVILSLGFIITTAVGQSANKIKKNRINSKKNEPNSPAKQINSRVETEPICSDSSVRGEKGQWCTDFESGVVAVHISVLPNGKVLYWGKDSLGTNPNKYTRVQIWNPNAPCPPNAPDPTNPCLETFDLSHTFGNLFCSGHSFLPDGRLLVAGGNNDQAPDRFFSGIDKAALYNYATNQWTPLDQMNGMRWYPTNLTLGNGNVLVWGGTTISGGFNKTPQILEKQFNGNYSWHSLNVRNEEDYNLLYSWNYLLSSGKVFVISGWFQKSWLLSLGDRFQRARLYRYPPKIEPTVDPAMDGVLLDPHDAGSSVLYDTDRIMIVGGFGFVPKYTVDTIDFTTANPTWNRVGRMNHSTNPNAPSGGRRHHNATLLPDGKVLVTGGNQGSGFNNNCLVNFVKMAEMWDPADPGGPGPNLDGELGKWKQLASATERRLYHSTAVLLPDGRVLTGGTTDYDEDPPLPVTTDCPTHTNNFKMEIFSPPYLFNSDGTPAERPQIISGPSQVLYGQTVQFTVSGTGSDPKVTLIRLPSVTHGFNQNQGVLKLQPTVNGQNLSVTIPTNRNALPPGHYMMFVLNSRVPSRVPSVAKIIQVL